MKKTILAMLFLGSSCAVFAQDSLNSNNNSLNTNTSYNAYSAFTATPPVEVQSYIIRDYPTVTNVKWQNSSPDWWHGYYITNGQPMHVYYNTYFNTRGQFYTVALPVKQSFVPDAVVSKVIDLFGPTLYDITTVKGSSNQDIYAVRILENGQVSTQWMDENGNKVIDIYRVETVETTDAAMNTEPTTVTTTDTNAATEINAADKSKMKMKMKTEDGKKIKTKIENGKVKEQ